VEGFLFPPSEEVGSSERKVACGAACGLIRSRFQQAGESRNGDHDAAAEAEAGDVAGVDEFVGSSEGSSWCCRITFYQVRWVEPSGGCCRIRRFAFQRGVTWSSRSQLGRPA
jgi:hypothetical protein